MYTNFESISHAGLRTTRFFIPSLHRDSEKLEKYAADGGHLYRVGCSPQDELSNFTSRIALWNGNVQMIKRGSSADVAQVSSRIRTILQHVSLEEKPMWAHLVTPACIESPAAVLVQRAGLLQLLCDSPNKKVPLLSLPAQMVDFRIAEQLAAVDLVTFRTLKDTTGCEYEAVAPYHPVVIDQFIAHKAAVARASTWW